MEKYSFVGENLVLLRTSSPFLHFGRGLKCGLDLTFYRVGAAFAAPNLYLSLASDNDKLARTRRQSAYCFIISGSCREIEFAYSSNHPMTYITRWNDDALRSIGETWVVRMKGFSKLPDVLISQST